MKFFIVLSKQSLTVTMTTQIRNKQSAVVSMKFVFISVDFEPLSYIQQTSGKKVIVSLNDFAGGLGGTLATIWANSKSYKHCSQLQSRRIRARAYRRSHTSFRSRRWSVSWSRHSTPSRWIEHPPFGCTYSDRTIVCVLIYMFLSLFSLYTTQHQRVLEYS